MMELKKNAVVSTICGITFGGLLAWLLPAGQWWITWLSSTFLLVIAFFILFQTVQWLVGEKKSLTLTLTAFLSRLLIGVVLMVVLPNIGYDTDQQNAGYLFQDAFARDTAAWKLADSEDSLFSVFNAEFFEDQYGGLSFISAATYRFLSPDAHRPQLVLILTSFMFAFGMGFFYEVLAKRWNEKLAWIASWFVVLYPEGIFYTVSQMREPMVIGIAMVLMWCVVTWFETNQKRKALLVGNCAIFLMMMISWRTGMGIVLMLVGWSWIEHIVRISSLQNRRKAWLTFGIVLLIGGAGVAYLTGEWLRVSIWWDMREMLMNSGRVALIVEDAPVVIQWLFITIYGVFQVVLPAALVDTAAAVWKGLTIARSSGWYLLLPLLVYGLVAVWQQKERKQQMTMLWFLLVCWGWIFFSSLRAGGDMWDNPRYRTVFLPWFAILAVQIWQLRDHWLWRILSIEGFALLVFAQWYLSRYLFQWDRLSVMQMIVVILGFAVLVGASGIYTEFRKKKAKKSVV